MVSLVFQNQIFDFIMRPLAATLPAGGKMVYTEYPCYSPIYCASGAGYFLEAILRHGGSDPSVVETKCQTLGDSSCTYEMTWK